MWNPHFNSRLHCFVLITFLLVPTGGSVLEEGDGSVVVPSDGKVCDYQCSRSGGCSVKYVGPLRPGKNKGSCASRLFGGICRGTPVECLDCNKALHCEAEAMVTKSNQSDITSQSSHTGNMCQYKCKSNGGITSHTENMCQYKCKSNGGCSATFIGTFRSGPFSGSCVPPSFGGKCSGIPEECGTTCLTFCSDNSGSPLTTGEEVVHQVDLTECLQCNKTVEYGKRGDNASILVSNSGEIHQPATLLQNICDYKCLKNGGCSVTYVGPPKAGKFKGSCISESYGGTCHGIPGQCLDCNKALQCALPTLPESNHTQNMCQYKCKSNGGCSAKYIGPFRSGSLSGSCAPSSFGGKCFGIPEECGSTCLTICSDNANTTEDDSTLKVSPRRG